MLAKDFLQLNASRQPDKICLVCNNERYTYAQIDTMANRLANALQEQGVRHGDRVAILMGNSLESVVAIFATMKAGGAFVTINIPAKIEKLRIILNHCRASALLIDSRFTRESYLSQLSATVPSLYVIAICGDLTHLKHGLPRRCIHFSSLIEQAHARPPPNRNKPRDLACLIYTAGPKGSMTDHTHMEAAISSLIQCCQNDERDIVLNTLPLSSDYGLYQLLTTFKFGGRLILSPDLHQPANILTQIEHEQATGLPGIPGLFTTLIHLDSTSRDLTSLRYFANTAAALPSHCIKSLHKQFPSATLYSIHGISSKSQSPYLPPALQGDRPSFAGIPIPGTEIWFEWLKKAACV